MAIRIATMTDLSTGETIRVERGTAQYIDLKNQGWVSKEQISHMKYRRDYEPDYTDEPEESTTDVDVKELLRQKAEEVYNKIFGQIDEHFPEYKSYHKPERRVDYSEEKESTLSKIDDLYGSFDTDEEFINYIETIMPSVNTLLEVIELDSDQLRTERAISQLSILLNGGNALTPDVSKLIGNSDNFNGTPLGTHNNSSRVKDRY